MLNTYCTHSFAFKAVPVLKIKPHLFNLATVCVRDQRGGQGLSPMNPSTLCFPSANQAGASGRAGTAGKSVFDVRAAETLATELLLPDTACAWAKKPVSLDVAPQGALLPACLTRKGRIGRDKKPGMYATSTRITGPLRTVRSQKKQQMWSHASLHCVSATVGGGTYGSFVTVTFLMESSTAEAECNCRNMVA